MSNATDTKAAAPSAPSVLRAENISRLYPDGDVHALENVSLEIRRGEYVAIMGPSGSGKSTLLNLLGALDRPSSGEIFFEGEPLSKLADLDRFRSQKLGFVFQSFNLLSFKNAVLAFLLSLIPFGTFFLKRLL